MKKFMSLFLVLVLVFSMTACGGSAGSNFGGSTDSTAENPLADSADGLKYFDDMPTFNFATGGQGGGFYMQGTSISSLADKYLNVRLMVQATASSIENLALLREGAVEFAITRLDTSDHAYSATDEYEGEEPLDNMRFVMTGIPGCNQFIATKKSGITSFADIKGKRIGMPPAGSPAGTQTVRMLKANGLEEGDYMPVWLSNNEITEQMKNGDLEVACYASSLPTTAVIDLVASMDVIFLSMPEEAVEYGLTLSPYLARATCPAGTYDGQDYEVVSMTDPGVIVCDENVDDEVVYNLVKMILIKNDELIEIYESMKYLTPENSVSGAGVIPLHPGAERYYKEVGLLD